MAPGQGGRSLAEPEPSVTGPGDCQTFMSDWFCMRRNSRKRPGPDATASDSRKTHDKNVGHRFHADKCALTNANPARTLLRTQLGNDLPIP